MLLNMVSEIKKPLVFLLLELSNLYILCLRLFFLLAAHENNENTMPTSKLAAKRITNISQNIKCFRVEFTLHWSTGSQLFSKINC